MILPYERMKFIFGNLAAAGTSEVKTAVVDMGSGLDAYDGLLYLLTFGDNVNASVVTITAKENTANSTTSPTPTSITLKLGLSASGLGTAAAISSGNLVITCATSDTDNKIVPIYVDKRAMSKQYQFLSVTPATQNAVIASIVCIGVLPRVQPVTQPSDVIAIAYAGV